MSHRLISGALQKHGMTRKRLEYVAKQRILAERARCRLTLQRMAEAGMMEDVIIIDEVHQADHDDQLEWAVVHEERHQPSGPVVEAGDDARGVRGT